ncbi:MAG: thioredoxin [Candidatus Krumholzibacteriia bacterium]
MCPDKLTPLSDDEWDEKVRRGDRAVVVDFWAPWCEPCTLVDPILEKLAAKYEGSVEFLKMNIDEEKAVPSKYAVRSIPTILFFKQGKISNQIIGVETEEAIEKAIQELL